MKTLVQIIAPSCAAWSIRADFEKSGDYVTGASTLGLLLNTRSEEFTKLLDLRLMTSQGARIYGGAENFLDTQTPIRRYGMKYKATLAGKGRALSIIQADQAVAKIMDKLG